MSPPELNSYPCLAALTVSVDMAGCSWRVETPLVVNGAQAAVTSGREKKKLVNLSGTDSQPISLLWI